MRRNQASPRLSANSLQLGLQGIIFLDHSAGHQSSLVLGNDYLIGSRSANGVGVALLPGSRNDFQVWIQRSRSHGDVQIVGVVVDHNADSLRTLNSSRLQNVVPLRVSLDDHEAVFQEFTIKSFVGFNEDKRNLEAAQLIHYRAANLTVSANNEMAFYLFEADFVDHGFPNLRPVPAEDGDRNPLCNPDLKGKNSHEDKQGKEFSAVVNGVVIDRVRIEDPEQSILPAQTLQLHVNPHTQKAEAREEQEG